MKRSLGVLLSIIFFIAVLSSCEKKEILQHKTVFGEATINDNSLLQYMTIGEGISEQYWFLPFGGIGDVFIVKEGVCYLQLFLREREEKDADNFWLILIGCSADENFPIIGKEYKIVVQNQVDLGYNISNSFYWNGKLRDFYADHPEFKSYGIAGLSIPPSPDKFIPLDGSIQFLKGDLKAGEYSISYNLKSKENAAGEIYRITGIFNGKLKVVD